MIYALIINEEVVTYPYTISNLKKDNPGVSFPSTIPSSVLEEYNVKEVSLTAYPVCNNATQKVIANGCVFNSNSNNWETSWSVVNLTLSDTQNVLQEKELEVRAERNEKLVHCDWTQLSDTSANSVLWANYRQQLRDIPLQEGFPWDVNWPDSPQ
jgi:hypothetical protein